MTSCKNVFHQRRELYQLTMFTASKSGKISGAVGGLYGRNLYRRSSLQDKTVNNWTFGVIENGLRRRQRFHVAFFL